MIISSGQPESHESLLPLNTAATPGVAPPTQRFPSGTEQGGTVTDSSGIDFTDAAQQAMTTGMSNDAGRRGRYAGDISPAASSYGDEMILPAVVSDQCKHTGGSDAVSYDPAG